jgi:hypothetical protein
MFRRTTAVAILMGLIGIPTLAQNPNAERLAQREQLRAQKQQQQGQQRPARDPQKAQRQNDLALVELQRVLNLNDFQVGQVRSLANSRNQELERLDRIRPDKNALREARQQKNPNPTQLGNAILDGKQYREQVQIVQGEFQMRVKELLSPEQRQYYDGMQNAANNMKAFRALGLIRENASAKR